MTFQNVLATFVFAGEMAAMGRGPTRIELQIARTVFLSLESTPRGWVFA